MLATFSEGAQVIQTGIIVAIGGKFFYDRFLKKGAIIDHAICDKCRREIEDKLGKGDMWFKQIARSCRIQALVLIKLCEALPSDISEDECKTLRRQLEDGFDEETRR